MGDSVGPPALTAESSKVAGATLEDAKEGVAECTYATPEVKVGKALARRRSFTELSEY